MSGPTGDGTEACSEMDLGEKAMLPLPCLCLIFIILAFSGYALLGVDGAGSGLGMWHYRIGLLSLVLFSGHIIRRIPVLRKNTKGKLE